MNESSVAPAELIRFMRRGRQSREFLPEPVPEEALNDILEVARWTGSSMNRQVWRFVVVRDPALRARLGEIAQSARHFGRAPAVIVITMPDADPIMDAHDEGRVSERILLAARAHGLGAGVGWFRPGERAAVRQLLHLEPGVMVRTGIAIGRPVPRPRRAGARKPLADLVQWDDRVG